MWRNVRAAVALNATLQLLIIYRWNIIILNLWQYQIHISGHKTNQIVVVLMLEGKLFYVLLRLYWINPSLQDIKQNKL